MAANPPPLLATPQMAVNPSPLLPPAPPIQSMAVNPPPIPTSTSEGDKSYCTTSYVY